MMRRVPQQQQYRLVVLDDLVDKPDHNDGATIIGIAVAGE
jgi:hypothetical protein